MLPKSVSNLMMMVIIKKAGLDGCSYLCVKVGTILAGANTLQEELAHRHLLRSHPVAGGEKIEKKSFKEANTTSKDMGF